MGTDRFASIEQKLIGRQCTIVRQEFDWLVDIHGGGCICLPIPWRIVADGVIAFADQDDGHQFGLPVPLDGQAEANRFVQARPITKVSIDRETADLSIHFGNAIRLDAFNYSANYEGWQISLPPQPGGMKVVALGGGDLAIWE